MHLDSGRSWFSFMPGKSVSVIALAAPIRDYTPTSGVEAASSVVIKIDAFTKAAAVLKGKACTLWEETAVRSIRHRSFCVRGGEASCGPMGSRDVTESDRPSPCRG